MENADIRRQCGNHKMSETALKAMLPFYGNITAILPVFTQWDKGRRMHWTVPAMR